MFNVPEQALEPKEDANAELITNVVNACENTNLKLRRARFEYDDVKSWLNTCKFLNLDLKAKIFEQYDEKIERFEQDIRDFSARLEELGAF